MNTSTPPNEHEAIACLARELWEQGGRPTGCELTHWLAAEKQIAEQRRPLTVLSLRPPAAAVPQPRSHPAPAPARERKSALKPTVRPRVSHRSPTRRSPIF